MFDIPGWENTRQFFAIFKRVHGTDCHFASSFLKSEDIALAIALYQQLGDPGQTVHFQELACTYDAPAFQHFEFTILAAAEEQGSHNPFETTTASPFATQQRPTTPNTAVPSSVGRERAAIQKALKNMIPEPLPLV
jgi:hypothetical protein